MFNASGSDPSPAAALQVQWELVMANLIGGGWSKLTELGPGVALRSACRHINQDVASKSFTNIEV